MNATITINHQPISLQVRKHPRSKRISMRLRPGNHLVVTIPKFLPYLAGKTFAQANTAWIKQHLHQIQNHQPKVDSSQKPLLRQKARELIRQRLDYYNQHYGYTFHRITIRDQKTRWGSCSSQKTLSFNYKLALLPLELVDYVVVHELCHLKEMNHSSRFWNLVAQTLPHYPLLKRQLKEHEVG